MNINEQLRATGIPISQLIHALAQYPPTTTARISRNAILLRRHIGGQLEPLQEHPPTFRTSDGYTLHLQNNQWTNGDLTFDNSHGRPIDTHGQYIPGTIIAPPNNY